MVTQDRYRAYFDEAWKKIIERTGGGKEDALCYQFGENRNEKRDTAGIAIGMAEGIES